MEAANDDAPSARGAPPRRHAVVGLIAVGGAAGAVARYEVAQVVHVAKDSFPWATLVTNLSGAFALGLLLTVLFERFPSNRHLRPLVAIGFLGAFTTFSTMAVETVTLVKDGFAVLGIGYLLVSVVTGLVATSAGVAIARSTPRREPRVPGVGRC